MTPSGNFLGVCTTDEDGNQAYEFKDGFGRTILAGRMDGPDPCFAYYEYDNHDDLVNVYPPFVTYYQMNEPEGPYQTQSSYSYHYDFLHRCVYKKLPERDAIYYIYDHGGEPTIPSRRGAKFERRCDWWFYMERHLVENYFLKLKAFRRIATRYDKLAFTYLGFLCIVSILIWLK